MGKQWRSIYVDILDHPIWALGTLAENKIFVTLILMASHKEKEWEFNGEKYILKPGELIITDNKIIERCHGKVTRQNVRTAIGNFVKRGFIEVKNAPEGRLIRIINWNKYQRPYENMEESKDKDTNYNQKINNIENYSYNQKVTIEESLGSLDVSKFEEVEKIKVTKGQPALNQPLTKEQPPINQGLTTQYSYNINDSILDKRDKKDNINTINTIDIIDTIDTIDTKIQQDINITNNSDIYDLYKSNGFLPNNPIIINYLDDVINIYGKSWVKEAICISVKNNKKMLSYILGILKICKEKNASPFSNKGKIYDKKKGYNYGCCERNYRYNNGTSTRFNSAEALL